MDDLLKDSRFSHIAKDPKFASIPQKERKVKIDDRFRAMFKDKNFKLKYSVDKRGRPANYTTDENLKKYYAYDSDEESESEEEVEGKKKKSAVKTTSGTFTVSSAKSTMSHNTLRNSITNNEALSEKVNDKRKSSDDSEESDSDNVDEKDLMSAKLKDPDIDYARAQAFLEDSSSSDDDDSSGEDDGSDDEGIIHSWGELDLGKDTEDSEGEECSPTRRVAVCNMDWDRVKARDIFVLLGSFCPSKGVILRVKVYPSDFGLRRMEQEKLKGPKEIVQMKPDEAQEDEEDYQREKLREYQMKRLRYYYAVAEFDSPETAEAVCKQCDNMEYESSATRMDLRFIPNDMTFDDREPRDSCDGSSDVEKYEPNLFINTALQQVKVRCTWDETDPNRIKTLNDAVKRNETNVSAYLASSSSDEEEDEQSRDEVSDGEEVTESDRISRYRSLLKEIEQKEEKKKNDVELEITWEPELKKAASKLVSQKQQEKDLTPWETFLKKKKDKKKSKKKDEKAFSDDELPPDVNLDDPFFKQDLSDSDSRISEENQDDQQKKGELDLLLMDEHEGRQHFNFKDMIEDKKKKKKWKKRKEKAEVKEEEDFEVDVKDPRFNALYTSHHFNIDPSESAYKQTGGMRRIAEEKLKRRELPSDESFQQKSSQETQINPELSALVKSVKRKAQNANLSKKRRKS